MAGISREQAALLFKAIKARNKYGANRTQSRDGSWFASKAESARYEQLRLFEKCGQILNLVKQPRYPLFGKSGVRIGTYVADFRFQTRGGTVVVEDVKSKPTARTQMYRRNKKHFEADYGIKITEIA